MAGPKRYSESALFAHALAAGLALASCPEVDLKTAARKLAAPDAPGAVAASVLGMTSAKLAWEDRSGNETGFEIERELVASPGWADAAAVGANLESWSDEGLKVGSTYLYRVRAANDAGASDWIYSASVTTLSAVIEVDLTVQVYPDGAGQVLPSGTSTVVQGAATDIAATPGSGYSFARWEAVSGEAVFGDAAVAETSVTLPDGAAAIWAVFDAYPAAGGGGALTASAVASTGFHLAWAAAADGETAASALQYRVVYSANTNYVSTAAAAEAAIAGGDAVVAKTWTADILDYTLSGLAAGTKYYVNVFVKDEVGNIGPYTSREGAANLQVYNTDTNTYYGYAATYSFGVIFNDLIANFTIVNKGFGTLDFTNVSPNYVTVSAAPFSIDTQPAADAIAPDDTRTFIVRMTHSWIYSGAYTATVGIPCDDPDEPDFYFSVSGIES